MNGVFSEFMKTLNEKVISQNHYIQNRTVAYIYIHIIIPVLCIFMI